MCNDLHVPSACGNLREPLLMIAADLDRRRPERLLERVGVARARIRRWSRAARDNDERAVSMLATGVSERTRTSGIRERFGEPDRGCILHPSQLPAHAVCVGERRVEEGETVDATACGDNGRGYRIDSAEGEWFQRGPQPDLPDAVGQPFRGNPLPEEN